jgi:hypothetical protein
VVPQVPVCTYAHARRGSVQFAERAEKKTGTNWDRDQQRCSKLVELKRTMWTRRPLLCRKTHQGASAAVSWAS